MISFIVLIVYLLSLWKWPTDYIKVKSPGEPTNGDSGEENFQQLED